MHRWAFLWLWCTAVFFAPADAQETLTNKDVEAYGNSGKFITKIGPDVPDKADALPADDWEAADRENEAAYAEQEQLEQEQRENEEAEREKEEAGFYRQDPDNPNKQLWVDPEDEDFRSQLKDRRRNREKEQRAAEQDGSEGNPRKEESPESGEDTVQFINPRTKDIETISKTDPRLKRIEREIRNKNVQLQRVPEPEEE